LSAYHITVHDISVIIEHTCIFNVVGLVYIIYFPCTCTLTSVRFMIKNKTIYTSKSFRFTVLPFPKSLLLKSCSVEWHTLISCTKLILRCLGEFWRGAPCHTRVRYRPGKFFLKPKCP